MTNDPGDGAAIDAAIDAALVHAACSGDREAFGQLVRRHLAVAHRAARALLADAADVDDCCQDAFLAALVRLDECRPATKFRGWLLVIVRHRALDLLRRQRVRRAEPLDDGGASLPEALLATPAPGPHELAERAELRARLTAALATLTPARRRVVLLHDVEGWSHREIAARLGIAEGTVRAHLFWARRGLRAMLEPMRTAA